MSSLTMGYLLKWDSKNRLFAELATEVPTRQNGGVSADGLQITYHLRKNVNWSDGAPFSADDVVWTYHAIMNPANNIPDRTGWDRVTRVEAPDKNTVVFHLSRPFSPVLETFFVSPSYCILPKHLLARFPNINQVAYNSLPIGIGPFTYERWNRGQSVVMVANPSYWRGRPKLREVDFEDIVDVNTLEASLKSHELDLWYSVPPGSYVGHRLNALAGFASITQPSYLTKYLFFNTQRPAVRDVAVRKALEYATDRVALNEKVNFGANTVQEQPAPRTSPYWDAQIVLAPFDIANANQILDSAGWKRSNDGIRARNGVRLSLVFASLAGWSTADRTIELLRSWWKQIGVEILVKRYSSNLLFGTYQDGGIMSRGNWDISIAELGNDPLGDYSATYACDRIPPYGENYTRWCNPIADKAMRDLFDQSSQARRSKDVAIVEELLQKNTPTIVLDSEEDIYLFNSDVRGFHPGDVSQFDQFMNVDI